MHKRGLLRGLARICDAAGFAARLIRYDLLLGSRDGLVKISSGITASGNVSIRLGKRVFLGRNGVFQGTGAIDIAAGTYVGNYFDFNCRARISIGDNCMLGNFVTIVDNNHGTSPNIDMKLQPMEAKEIVIERNCWLGEKATVLSGVTIHENAIVAAGSVVTRDVPANAIVGGVPARVLRMRDCAVAS